MIAQALAGDIVYVVSKNAVSPGLTTWPTEQQGRPGPSGAAAGGRAGRAPHQGERGEPGRCRARQRHLRRRVGRRPGRRLRRGRGGAGASHAQRSLLKREVLPDTWRRRRPPSARRVQPHHGSSSRWTRAWRPPSCAEAGHAASSSPPWTWARRAGVSWPAWSRATLSLKPVHRFPNGAREVDGRLRWPMPALRRGADRTRCAGRALPQVESIGIDTWGVDYGLLDTEGGLWPSRCPTATTARPRWWTRCTPWCRPTSSPAPGCSSSPSPPSTSWRRATRPLWPQASALALLPDLLAYWLTGELRTETHQRVHDRAARRPYRRVGPRAGRAPGRAGGVAHAAGVAGDGPRAAAGGAAGARAPPRASWSTTVGSHDTASAVAPCRRHRPLRLHLERHVVLVGVELIGGPLDRGAGATSPTSKVWTAGSASCATPAACGCCRSRCGPGPKRGEWSTHSPDGGCSGTACVLIDVDDAFVPGSGAVMPERIAAGAVAWPAIFTAFAVPASDGALRGRLVGPRAYAAIVARHAAALPVARGRCHPPRRRRLPEHSSSARPTADGDGGPAGGWPVRPRRRRWGTSSCRPEQSGAAAG